jgi:hypothetical protein
LEKYLSYKLYEQVTLGLETNKNFLMLLDKQKSYWQNFEFNSSFRIWNFLSYGINYGNVDLDLKLFFLNLKKDTVINSFFLGAKSFENVDEHFFFNMKNSSIFQKYMVDFYNKMYILAEESSKNLRLRNNDLFFYTNKMLYFQVSQFLKINSESLKLLTKKY